MTNRPRYVLVTPVRNEEQHVGLTINAVAAQTLLPERWVIVSDGSTDGTDNIIRSYESSLPFLRFVRRDAGAQRDFRSKVMAIHLGLDQLAGLDYDFIGNLDGDVSFAPDYFDRLLACFAASPRLGVAGGLIHEDSTHSTRAQFVQTGSSVAGAVQMFRRACFDQIGGYPPLRYGGEDAAMELMARMRGWETRTIRELTVRHHRPAGVHGRGMLRSFYDMGRREALLGYRPLFELFRCINRMLASPVLLGGLVQFAGFAASKLRGDPVELPADCVRFLQEEQTRRLRAFASLGKFK
jgi:glycosyltransferase involved in cell wall biosynthesis